MSDFYLQKRAAGSPNMGMSFLYTAIDDKGSLNADVFPADEEHNTCEVVVQKRAAGSPNMGMVVFQVGLAETSTPAQLIRSDIFGNAVGNQKQRGGF